MISINLFPSEAAQLYGNEVNPFSAAQNFLIAAKSKRDRSKKPLGLIVGGLSLIYVGGLDFCIRNLANTQNIHFILIDWCLWAV
jgi:hypothetical protein